MYDQLVSIIIPTKNRLQMLTRSINSALAQTYKQIEIIIVDDSENGTAIKVFENYSDQRIKYYKNIRAGANAARNYGVEKSKGIFITFLDDDDEYHANKVEVQFEKYTEAQNYNKAEVIIYGGLSTITLKGDVISYSPKYEGNICNYFLIYNFASMITLFMKKETYLKVGGMDESLEAGQEWDLNIRLSLKYNYYSVASPIVTVYRHDNNRDIELGKAKYHKILKSIRLKYKHEWTFYTHMLNMLYKIKKIYRSS
jgi:O-antigen biosynthesis protein